MEQKMFYVWKMSLMLPESRAGESWRDSVDWMILISCGSTWLSLVEQMLRSIDSSNLVHLPLCHNTTILPTHNTALPSWPHLIWIQATCYTQQHAVQYVLDYTTWVLHLIFKCYTLLHFIFYIYVSFYILGCVVFLDEPSFYSYFFTLINNFPDSFPACTLYAFYLS